MIVNATNGPDAIRMAASEGSPLVDGLTADVRVRGSEVGDGIVINALGGADAITMPVGTPGAATVLGDGGADVDTAFYDGTATADQIAVTANALVPRVDAAATAPFEAAGNTESLVVRGLGGNDTISAVGNLAASSTRADVRRRRGRRHPARLERAGPAGRQLRQRPRRRPAEQRRRPARKWQRHVPVGPGRRQRHCRRTDRHRHHALQRLRHRRAARGVGQRRPRPLHAQHRHDHDGPRRRRACNAQRPRRHRRRHRSTT